MTSDAGNTTPDFRSRDFLVGHIRQIMDFYHPRCINDEHGGFFNIYHDDGTVLDSNVQHIVSTTRFIVNFSLAAKLLDRPDYLDVAAHGLRHLAEVHHDAEHGGYFWILDGREPRDATKHCYGHAFVLLAFATATKAGIAGAREKIGETFDLLEQRFWEPEARLYKDEISRDWSTVSPYRGQNANMHMTEALIASYEATGEARYLDRAETLAERLAVDLAGKANDLIWEHYHTDWSVDWDYNRHDPKHIFRPYGYVPGHQTEWAKLLLILERYRKRDWMLPRARHLFDVSMARSADFEFGGMHYTFGPDGQVFDRDKHHWVLSETIAAAACMGARTGEEIYWQQYDWLWGYSWRHLVDRERGGWYRVLKADGEKYDEIKTSTAKAEYHPFGACYEVLRVLGELN